MESRGREAGFSAAAAKAPPSVEMTGLWAEQGEQTTAKAWCGLDGWI